MAASDTVLRSASLSNSTAQTPSIISVRNGVVTLFGYGTVVRVDRGHLILEDGIGNERRSARFARVYHGLKRLVAVGSDGMVSLAALRWLADQGASFVMLERDGSVLATTGPVRSSDARLRRAQALAENTGVGLQLAIDLIGEKLAGQRRVAMEKLRNSRVADEISRSIDELKSSKRIEAVLIIEATAALSYWSAWADLPIAFSKIDSTRVPDHWHVFGSRVSPITKSPRQAVNPPNAILNYLYAVVEAEARLAAAELGLDPGLGVLHKDRPNRDSLACDLMEPVRPLVDAYLFDWLSRGPLRKKWFFEQTNGNCRLMGEFVEQLSGTSSIWQKAIGPIAERAVKILWQGRAKRSTLRELPSRLTQSRRSEGRSEYRKVVRTPVQPAPKMEPRCPICGGAVKRESAHCTGCAPLVSRITLLEAAKLGRIATHTPEAEARRSATRMKQVEALKRWSTSDLPTWLDEEYYRNKIIPSLAGLTLKTIRTTIDVSNPYAAMIRKGERIPHPRHWLKLADLVGITGQQRTS